MTINPMRPLVLATLLLTAACGDNGDNGTGPENELPSGSVAFTATGELGGSFSASGAPEMENGQVVQAGTWALGGKEDDALAVVGFRARPNNRADYFVLGMDGGAGTGTRDISSDCGDGETCTGVIMLYDTPTNDTDGGTLCSLMTGSVTVTSVSGDRAQGTFQGEGVCLGDGDEPAEWTVSNGTFNVPLVEEFLPSAQLAPR